MPAGAAQAELREKRSRFLARIVPVEDAAAARRELQGMEAHWADATHHCWAWRLGPEPVERASDAGEPAGTAGLPILQVLRGAGLHDVLAVVVRWFGGVKLGKGGLVRAYAEATRLAVAELPTRRRFPTETLVVELPYAAVGAVKRLVHPPEVELAAEEYGEAVRLTLVVHCERRPALVEALASLGLAHVPGG